MEVGERGGVGADDLDLAKRRAVEQRNRVARPRGLAWIARSGSSGPYHAGLSQPPYSRICAPSARCSASSGRRRSGLTSAPRLRPAMTPIGTGTKGGR